MNRVRQQLLEIVDAMLDGARQSVHLGPESVTRMTADLRDALPLFEEPEVRQHRDAIGRVLDGLAAGYATAEGLVAEVTALRSALRSLKTTYTALFLPYNAAMWDSMDTVWESAQADPDCEAIVMPVPFAERNTDGTAKRWLLHGADQFPPGVPLRHWEDLDIAALHPDVIYVHNPYDDRNTVTSVHPNFYSTALRPHTGMLVYLPYWVSGQEMPEHFDNASGFPNFDKVIYQSEQRAVPALPRWSGNKVVPLGSAKIDRVLRPRSVELPEDWAQQIAGKKVVLQLTSLNVLLNAREDTLRKLHEVLDALEDHDDLLLWWRPHPLERATMNSMLPGLRKAYDIYERRVMRSPQAIIDTTMDLHRAIAVSDAYLGHRSSVVELYGFTGKPIVLLAQNVTTDQAMGVCMPDDWVPQWWPAEQQHFARYARSEGLVHEGALRYLRRKVSENGGIVPGQREWFQTTASNADGTAGERIHRYIMSCVEDA